MNTAAESSNLPSLIDRACQRLAQARSSAEVLEARAIAEAALHYAKVTTAANETHADCLRMIVRAEMRMADEIDKGQERGEVAGRGDRANVRGADIYKCLNCGSRGCHICKGHQLPATLDDLGVSRQRLSEWREVRDAGPEVVERAIGDALAEGRAPTKADIRRAVEQSAPPPVKLAPPSNGLQFARIAIMKLEEIRDDDVERLQAFDLVRRWIDARVT